MKNIFRIIPFGVLAISLFCGKIQAQNVQVSGALTGNGLYPTVEAAFTAINSGAQTGATISVAIIGNTTEAATATLNAGAWASLSIFPAGGSARTVTGNIAAPLIDFNGADRVGIDGLNTGGNSLVIENTSTVAGASTIRFINDADIVGVQNCTILGSGTSTTSGTVLFSTGVSTGNDSITFNTCTIDASAAGNPVNGVYSAGTAGQENGTIVFNACNVANFFNAGSVTCGILVAANNTAWTIQNSRFFQSALRTYTTANTHRAIQISSGNGHLISGNTIGYANAAATGIYAMTGTIATRFIAIDLSVGTTTTTTVLSNLVTAFSLGTSSGATTANGIWCGVNITGGNVTCTSNIIGGTSGTGHVVCVPTTTQGAVVGFNSSSNGTISISGNTIGGLSSSGSTAAVAGGVAGINVTGVATSMSITNNTIGNSTADNMRAGTSGLTTGSSIASGINLSSTPTLTTVTGNTIQNFSSYGTGTGGYVRGIWTAASTGSPNTHQLNSNIIHDLTTTSGLTTVTSGQAVAVGINLSTGTNGTANNNTIYNISYSGTAATQNFVVGITLANATTSTAANNLIYGLANGSTGTTATSPPVCAGILIRSGTTNVTVYNNMISLGSGQTSNTVFVGIVGNHGSTPDPIDRIWNNTINIEGTVTAGAFSTFGFHRGDFTATSRNQTVDIKNNIITNTRTGGTGSHYAIGNNLNATSSATGWAAGACNNNVLNANAATIGYWTSAQTIAGWRTASAGDALSYSGITVTYVNSANNLHLNMGVTATPIESGGTNIATYTTDYDGQTRPGPVGSVNGGAYAYDIGADEFDGVPLDGQAPVITYTVLTFTCATTDRVLTATITDMSGVPTAGILQPRIYFRKNAGPWFSTQGVLATGNATNGTWNFTISSTAMGGLVAGDLVDYYVIAQDVAPTPNITANPAGGLVATDVNTVTTPPTTPSQYIIGGFLNGTYTVGSGGDYATITAAVSAYNTSCLTGPVVFQLTDLLYSASEVFPITITANPTASSVNTLTIKPQATGTVITGSAGSIFRFSGADYVTIDGSVSSTVNVSCSPVVSASRDLSIVNSSTASLSSVIWFESLGTGAGATRNTIKNCTISAGVDQSATATETYDIVSCGSTITAFPPSDGLDNNYNTFENNSLVRATWGIYLRGGAASSNRGNTISQNTVGPAAFGSDQIRKGGIIIQNQDSAMIVANEVRCVGNQISQSAGGTDHVGIGVGGADGPTPTVTNVTNAVVTRNYVHDIVCEKTFSAIGIQLAASNATVSNNLISNNMINAVRSNATSPDQGIGINVVNGNDDFILFNTVNMVTADRDPGSSTTATQSDICYRFQAGAIGQTFRNNIGYIDAASNTGTLMNFVVVAPAASYAWAVSNNNDYAINAAGPQNVLFGLGTTGTIPPVATLAAWQGTFTPAQDANSITVVPVFQSSTDLHLMPGGNPSLENLAVPSMLVTTDFDCATRNATTPDMGADEACNLADVPVVTATPSAVCLGDSTTLSITSGSLNESTSWQWYESSCGTNAQGSGTSITVAPAVTSDYFVRAEGGCSVNTSCVMITVQVNALPTVTTTGSDTVCLNSMVTLAGNGATSYSWSGPETITDNVAFTPTVSGTYTITGTDGNGCEDTALAFVAVNPLPAVAASPLSNIVCAGGMVTLSGSGAVSYAWNGPESITDNVAFAPSLSGTYTVTGTDANGCTNTDTAMVLVNALPTVGASPASSAVCAGSQLTLSGSGATSYSWNGPDAVTDNIAFTPTVSGTYTVTGTDGNGCMDTATAVVVVNALPIVTYVEPVDTACQTTTVSFNLSGESPAGGNWSGPGVSGNTFDPMSANLGYNVVTYTYTDSVTGCANIAMDSVYVDLCLILTEISGDAGVSVYPNPNNGVFAVVTNAAYTEFTIEIMSVEGKIVFSNQHSNVNAGTVEQIDLTGFANGTYFVKVLADQQVNIIKLVKSE